MNKIKIIKEGRKWGKLQEYFILTNIKLRKPKTCDNLYCKKGEGENKGILSNTKKKNMPKGYECIAYGTCINRDRIIGKARKFCCIECLKENLGMRAKIFGNLNRTFIELKGGN